MPQFTYVAMDSKGKEQKGKINAANEEAVRAALSAKGMFPTSIKEEVGKEAAKQMSSKGGGKSGGESRILHTDLDGECAAFWVLEF